MNLRELEYICAVARLRHFGRAAKACNVSQPTLSSQIIKLEAELGVVLFERMRGAVQMTNHGQDIIIAAERAVQAAADIKTLAKSFKDPFTGELRLGVIPTIGPYLLPSFSGTLLHNYPKLQLAYIEDMTDRLSEQLLAGDMDAAIMATLPVDQSLMQIPLYDEKFHVVLPPGHPLCAQKSVSLQDLQNTSLLLLTEGHCLRDQTLSVCGTSQQNQAISATSMDTLLGLVAGGHGVTLIPTLAIRTGCIAELGVVVRPLSDASAFRRVNLTVRKSHVKHILIDALVALIHAQLPGGVDKVSGTFPPTKNPA